MAEKVFKPKSKDGLKLPQLIRANVFTFTSPTFAEKESNFSQMIRTTSNTFSYLYTKRPSLLLHSKSKIR